MRSIALGLLVLVTTPGCQDNAAKGQKPAQADVVMRVEALQKEESNVLARREELEREKEKVKEARTALDEKKLAAAKSGGDMKAIEEEEAALATRESKLKEDESANSQAIEKLLRQYAEEAQAGGAGGQDVTRREASVAGREKDFSRREEGIAKREAELASRERELAKREKDTCSVGTTTIVQAAPLPAGSKYTKRDVEPILQKARRHMQEKGILSSDLPSAVIGLEKEATESMASGEYGRAKFAADQLLATVDGMKVDKGFISAKIGRLNVVMKAKPVADGVRKDVDELFRGATGDYGDGKFTAANSKLNKIYSFLR